MSMIDDEIEIERRADVGVGAVVEGKKPGEFSPSLPALSVWEVRRAAAGMEWL